MPIHSSKCRLQGTAAIDYCVREDVGVVVEFLGRIVDEGPKFLRRELFDS